jgi:capsule biosynthesis phosphatase
MIANEKVVVFDVDGTLCEIKTPEQSYHDVKPRKEIVSKLLEYNAEGAYIILYSSRQMNTYQGNIGKINANTAKTLFEWLEKNGIPYDEVHFGKPWCGKKGFYVDDRTVRPEEIIGKSFDDVCEYIEKKRDAD